MKKQSIVYRLFVFLFSTVLIAGCSSTRSTTSSQMDPPLEIVDSGYQVVSADNANQSNVMVHPNKDRPSNMTLNDMMRRLPGVRIQSGRGQYARIVVGGPNTFMPGTDPLFVLNGIAVGTDYSTVYTSVNPNDVVSLSVLKGSDATIYGTRGANGVILIRTK